MALHTEACPLLQWQMGAINWTYEDGSEEGSGQIKGHLDSSLNIYHRSRSHSQ